MKRILSFAVFLAGCQSSPTTPGPTPGPPAPAGRTVTFGTFVPEPGSRREVYETLSLAFAIPGRRDGADFHVIRTESRIEEVVATDEDGVTKLRVAFPEIYTYTRDGPRERIERSPIADKEWYALAQRRGKTLVVREDGAAVTAAEQAAFQQAFLDSDAALCRRLRTKPVPIGSTFEVDLGQLLHLVDDVRGQLPLRLAEITEYEGPEVARFEFSTTARGRLGSAELTLELTGDLNVDLLTCQILDVRADGEATTTSKTFDGRPITDPGTARLRVGKKLWPGSPLFPPD